MLKLTNGHGPDFADPCTSGIVIVLLLHHVGCTQPLVYINLALCPPRDGNMIIGFRAE